MNKETIERFFRNECSSEEEREVGKYILNSQDQEDTQNLMQKVWNEPEFNDVSVNKKSFLFDKLKSDIENISSDYSRSKFNTNANGRVSRMPFIRKTLGIAASIILTLGLSFTMYYLNENSEEPIAQIAEIEKINSSGQRSRIVLRDGTKVFLNAESRIRYSDQAYGLSSRNVFLEGEAYFEVAKNPDMPFIVKTKDLSTTALGTAFNVRAFNDESSTQISLTEGKVRVARIDDNERKTEALILLPEEEVVLNQGELIRRNFNANKVLSWKDGVIYFEETDFNEAARVLERWYNVKIEIKNLKNNSELKGTGAFENESLDNVLKVLGYSLEFEYKIENDIVTINF